MYFTDLYAVEDNCYCDLF